MAGLDDLLAKALPRLAEMAPEKARALRRKLTVLLARSWTRGPERVARAFGVDLDDGEHAAVASAERAGEGEKTEAFLADVREAIGPERFVNLVRGVAKAYARAKKAAAEREAEPGAAEPVEKLSKSSERLPKAESKRLKAKSERLHAQRERLSKSSERLKARSDRLSKSSERLKAKSDRLKAKSERLARSSDRVSRVSDAGSISSSSVEESGEAELAVPDELAVPEEALEEAPLQITIEETPKKKAASEAEAAPSEDDGPDLAAARAIERWKKNGDDDELAQARRLYREAEKQAEAPAAKAAARAGSAFVELLLGHDDKAREHAKRALADDSRAPLAVSVLMRAERGGEGARERLRALLARARVALDGGKRGALVPHAKELEEAFPDEPFGSLVRIAEAQSRAGEAPAETFEAWKRYPSARFADIALGAGLDAASARGALAVGLQRLDKDDGAFTKTSKDTESKDNDVAGAFQVALGIARTALGTRSDIAKAEEQELRTVVGQALLGLQHFDHACEAFTKARALDRQSHLAYECTKGEERANVLRRAFDKPGIKAKLTKLEGVGLAAMRKGLAARLEKIAAERKPIDDELSKAELEAATALIADSARREKVVSRLRGTGGANAMSELEEAEKKLGELASAKDGIAARKDARAAESSGGGLFGKIGRGLGKALDGVKDAAKSVEIAARRQVLEAKRNEAVRALGRKLREAVPDDGWDDDALDGFIARSGALEARIDHLDDESNQVRKIVARAADA
jgi:hypothetical protein